MTDRTTEFIAGGAIAGLVLTIVPHLLTLSADPLEVAFVGAHGLVVLGISVALIRLVHRPEA